MLSDNSDKMIPSPPFCHLNGISSNDGNSAALSLASLEGLIVKMEDRRQAAYDLSRQVNKALITCRVALGEGGSVISGESDHEKELQRIMHLVLNNEETTGTASATPEESDKEHKELPPREANLSYRIEDYIRYRSFCHFLQTGRLIGPSAFASSDFQINDEEYLAGACIGLSRDLERYALGRATARDVHSVQLARNVVSRILEQLMQFDFRNGPLRRKYDGTKYALKTLETILYELSVTSSTDAVHTNNDDTDPTLPDAKRMKIDADEKKTAVVKSEEDKSIIPVDEMLALQKRMEQRDESREALIKRCRDAQKDSKNAIFAIHRGNMDQAEKLLKRAEDCITNDLMPIVKKVPSLRSSGCFAGVLEEYVEGKLFYQWMLPTNSKEEISIGKGAIVVPSGVLLSPQDFAHLQVDPGEYLGGLCDLTGEVGRFAVQCGTVRDKAGVQLCLHTNVSIRNAIEGLTRVPSPVGKKMSTLRFSVEKIERILYELSLVEATGRKHFKADSIRGMDRDENVKIDDDM